MIIFLFCRYFLIVCYFHHLCNNRCVCVCVCSSSFLLLFHSFYCWEICFNLQFKCRIHLIFSSLIIWGNFYLTYYHYRFRRAASDALDNHHVSILDDNVHRPQYTNSIRSFSLDHASQDTFDKVPANQFQIDISLKVKKFCDL